MFSERNDPFAAIDTANARGQRNPYLLPGQYHLRIDKCSCFESREGKLFWLVELEILSSDNAERPAGLQVSWMTNLRKDMGPINTKRFLAAAMSIDPDSDAANTEITKEVARLACSKEQPLHGLEIFAQCASVTTREGGDFLDVKWLPVVTPGAES
jgi:hypothetical protein